MASSRIRIGGSFQHDAGHGDALLFAAGEFQAALADLRVVAFGQGFDELVDLRGSGGRLDLGLRRVGAGIGDVDADGVVEEHGILGDDADRLA